MKTILYNPIFINPQAYYVFPRLTRYLQPDNESTAEPANYIGTIEVKVIAYGDTTLKRTYTNTDSIDLSEFKNTWIHISLFTKVGSCVLGEWKIGNMESDLPYIDPEVLASLKAVVIVGNKTNNDSDRAIVKNLVDPDNPFVISNAAYEGMSGYNGYPIILSGTNSTYQDKASYTNIVGDDKNIINITRISFNTAAIFSYIKQNGTLTDYNRNIESFKVKVTGIDYSKFVIKYSYISGTNATERTVISITSDGTYELPKSFASDGSLTSDNVWIGLNFTKQSTDIPDIIEDVNVTIEVLPEFEGAFVTDGVDDLITSTKTVQDMLEGSNEITIVSMVHQVKDTTNNVSFTNYIRGSINGYFRNIVNNYGKTGIYGYTSSDLRSLSVINNILGDKNDYTSNGDNRDTIINGNFNVQGYSYNNSNNTGDFSSVAWYWTVIANKVLTTDQINQVIAYYNLDRCVEPTVWYDVQKQGLSNDTPDSDWYLKDFSKNGFDMSLFNFAKKGNSGVGKYEADFLLWRYGTGLKSRTHDTFLASTDQENNPNVIIGIVNYTATPTSSDIDSFVVDVKIEGEAYLSYFYVGESDTNTRSRLDIKSSGRYTIPKSYNSNAEVNIFCGFYIGGLVGTVEVTQIPSHAGALCFDGVEDYGQFVGNLGLKDYTVVVDRAYNGLNDPQVPIIANLTATADCPFVFDFINNTEVKAISFGNNQSVITDVFSKDRKLVYQSTYVYNGKSILKGNSSNTGTGLVTGRYGNNFGYYSKLALYSMLLFPYSLSEFLIERQLKKHKLGTLYPDMVEFRPIVNSNVEWNTIEIWQADKPLYRPANGTNETGTYLQKDSTIGIYVKPKGVDEVTKIVVNGTEYTNLKINSNGFYYVTLPITTSPQKIDITIDEYIRYEDIDFTSAYPFVPIIEGYTWGDKLKVGDKVTYKVWSNMLTDLYSRRGEMKLNGENILSNSSITVEKSMKFEMNKVYLKSNEPKCILSPSRLRIPNSSYKILGYIPDISGHGNHGKINNSVYAGMSGVNGYPVVFGANKTWANESNGYVTSITSNTIHITNVLNAGLALLYSYVKYNGNLQNIKEIPPFKIEIKGLEGRSKFIYKYLATSDATKETNLYLGNGTHELPKSFLPTEALINNAVVGFSISPIEEGVTNFLSDITIKVLPEYEGAYCLDGVDDFVTIPTTVGGKQMLMKVNWDKTIADAILYDQRGYPNEFAIYNADNDNSGNPVFAYQARNNGQTYIDGILNKNIKASELRAITHNITITNELQAGVNQSYAVIGSNRVNDAYFTKMALYDFMLFDEISTDDKIKELNEYVGIEGNT